MIALLIASRPAAWFDEYPGVTDLQEAMGRPSICETTRLWFADQGELAAFAYVLEPYNNLVFEVASSYETKIDRDLVAWGMTCASYSEDDPAANTLDICCRDDDLRRMALLERQGFSRIEGNTVRMMRSLDDPLPPPRLPEDFSIRSIEGENEVDPLVALHRAAFGTTNMTREERLAIMRAPDYDASLDLIVIAPDGHFAAYCTCSISPIGNRLTGKKIGHTDPVATHPDYQRRGLAQALLLRGAQLLKDRGMELAILGTSSDNSAMQKAAQAAGFHVYSRTVWFSKPIPEKMSYA